ncbi:MAG: transglutaminase family protein [Pseudomonadota bacterium]
MEDILHTELVGPTLSVRVGCLLGYVATAPTQIFLLINPHDDSSGIIVESECTFNRDTPLSHAVDAYGNRYTRTSLQAGYNEIRQESILVVPDRPDNYGLPTFVVPIEQMPLDVLRYTFPSRYCESDKLAAFSWKRFGRLPQGLAQVQAICNWVNEHIEYRYGSGSSVISACDIIQREYGVCRDFAHVAIALCRALDLPARYVAGHIPSIVGDDSNDGDDYHYNDFGRDFHAYMEVYLGNRWHTFDARHNRPLKGRIKIAHGMDAVDAAFATFYGNVESVRFEVWSEQLHPVFSETTEKRSWEVQMGVTKNSVPA